MVLEFGWVWKAMDFLWIMSAGQMGWTMTSTKTQIDQGEQFYWKNQPQNHTVTRPKNILFPDDTIRATFQLVSEKKKGK